MLQRKRMVWNEYYSLLYTHTHIDTTLIIYIQLNRVNLTEANKGISVHPLLGSTRFLNPFLLFLSFNSFIGSEHPAETWIWWTRFSPASLYIYNVPVNIATPDHVCESLHSSTCVNLFTNSLNHSSGTPIIPQLHSGD